MRIDPQSEKVYQDLGVTYLYSNYDSASKYIQMTVEHNPNEPWGYVLYGSAVDFNKMM